MVFGFLALVILGIGFFNLQSASKQRQNSINLSEKSLPSVSRVNEIKINVTQFRLAELGYAHSANTDKRVRLSAMMEEKLQNLFIYKKTYEPLLETEAEQAQFEQFVTTWDKYVELHEKVMAAANQSKLAEADELVNSGEPLMETMNVVLLKLSNQHFDAAIEATTLAGISYDRAKWLLGGLVAFSVVLVLLAGAFIRYESQKQLGPLAVATGQFSEKIFASVEVLVSSTSSLRQSATESAASLEETVASMEELAALVKVNTATAQQAATLSVASQNSVTRGQEQIQFMIENIKDIHKSSSKITEILVLIEDIAFQTNLLALNAAVEAARAGEHGKGFAVVAEAVRSLAKNSAKSAKEIGELIHISIDKTDRGVKIATESEKSLREIVESVGSVAGLIRDIAAAAQEQHLGINQITIALTQIDRAIQSNVSSTEKISGLSSDMQQQSLSLDSLAVNLREFAGIKPQIGFDPDHDIRQIDKNSGTNHTLKAS